ncbi:VUT family protein [Legionella sp. km772]|uniref:VUT family protein n=1 Tax=Legionella sp. km772 TaxID=2498111 RepID=UPI000F8C55AA|nr:VUT family protein [Legionella sp. km772]RUR13139.1 VUT family protein [Legionella sp. km772]
MTFSSSGQQRSGFLFLSVSAITFLILLVNVSFKIILWHGLVFTVSSIVCPLIAGLYLLALRFCSIKEQRHLLNSSLMGLYLFCIGVFILVNLPASEYMHDNPVYQIIFDNMPKKFFATTISFVLSFYLPHHLFCKEAGAVINSPKRCVLLALIGGLSFFSFDFYFLFAGPHAHNFQQIFIDSFMVSLLLSLIIGVVYLSFVLDSKHDKKMQPASLGRRVAFPLYQYLIFFAVIVMLMCLACEYRIITFGKDNILTASCIFFPITMIVSTVLCELWGYRAHLKLIVALIGSQLLFDSFLLAVAGFPSPSFLNLNPFYNYIIPRRLPAASLSLLVTFLANSLVLHYLQGSKWQIPRWIRIVLANLCASSLLCFVDYSLLFWGVYPAEQVINLALHVWNYKLITTVLFLPVILWLCKLLEKDKAFLLKSSAAI